VNDEPTPFRNHPLWAAVGLGMWLGLPVLFAFRSWKTRKILMTHDLGRCDWC
jgi:hypothetical protein